VYEFLFDSIPAENDEQKTLAFRLRYEVYCLENRFEDPASHPNGIETDRFDAHSVHSLLVHRPTGTTVGTVRLILPRSPGSVADLPIHEVCPDRLRQCGDPALPLAATAEVSRLAMSKNLRACCPDSWSAGSADAPRRLVPYVSLGLMRSIVSMAARSGVTHLCAMMEPTLLRMLGRLGVHFHDLGPRVTFHGTRQPCYADLDALLARTWVERRDVWRILTCRGEAWPLNTQLVESHWRTGQPETTAA
jgi:N-acyl amino acid synthase of PEP-CTERM/exosortase system